jgi:hypothetical protein
MGASVGLIQPTHGRPLHNGLLMLSLVLLLIERQAEVWWLKRHPEAR